jgi:hypothetical protein
VSQIVLEATAPPRFCPAAGHGAGVRSHCHGKYCVQSSADGLALWWAPSSLVDGPDVESAYRALRDLSEGYVLPLLVHLQGMTGITAGARAVILEDALASRVAFIGTGPVDQVIAAFLEHGICESRYFECSVAAGDWVHCSDELEP